MKNLKLITQTLLALLCMALYTGYTIDIPTGNEHRFSNWLSDISPSLTRPRLKSNPEITFFVKSNLTNFTGEWKIHIPQKVANRKLLEKALRLLELSRESKIFSLSTAGTPSQSVHFEIRSESQHFSTDIPPSEIQHNISLQTLLQLINLYSENSENNQIESENSTEQQA